MFEMTASMDDLQMEFEAVADGRRPWPATTRTTPRTTPPSSRPRPRAPSRPRRTRRPPRSPSPSRSPSRRTRCSSSSPSCRTSRSRWPPAASPRSSWPRSARRRGRRRRGPEPATPTAATPTAADPLPPNPLASTPHPQPTPNPPADPHRPDPQPTPDPAARARPGAEPGPEARPGPGADPPPPPPPSTSGAQRAIAFARAQLGEPYRWGAAGPELVGLLRPDDEGLEAGGKYLPHYSVGAVQRRDADPLGRSCARATWCSGARRPARARSTTWRSTSAAGRSSTRRAPAGRDRGVDVLLDAAELLRPSLTCPRDGPSLLAELAPWPTSSPRSTSRR